MPILPRNCGALAETNKSNMLQVQTTPSAKKGRRISPIKREELAIKKRVWERDRYLCAYCFKNLLPLYTAWRDGVRKREEVRLTQNLKMTKKEWEENNIISRKAALLTVDHVQPRSKGGATSMANLVTACLVPCNMRKDDHEFLLPRLEFAILRARVIFFWFAEDVASWIVRIAGLCRW